MALLDLKRVSHAFGGPLVLDGVDFRVEKGERICLIGRNGEGKTTLLRMIAGALKPDTGEILRQPGLRVALLAQEAPEGMGGTIAGVVEDGFAAAGVRATADEAALAVSRVLTRFDLDGGADYASLSMGRKRSTLLARALVVDPDILLLDEPTNHLDIDAIARLERELQRFPGTLIFVTHDRAFLRAMARRIAEIDRGVLRDWDCDYDTFLVRRDELLAAELKHGAELDRKLAEEETWLRKGVLARRTRNEGRVRALQKLRDQRQARREVSGNATFTLQDTERAGKQVIRAKGLGFAWGETAIVRDFDTRIARGDKVGVIGPNGSGKSTLLRLLLGELAPAAGEVVHGTKLEIAYFDQQRAQLNEDRSVQENVADGADTVIIDGRGVHILTYLKQFLFSPDRARAPISHLSGGERNRLLLARLFTKPANLLVLDEPTNDLDLETVELLESLLVDFSGTILLVSHDREFLDNVATSTLVLEGDGRIAETVGGYSDWERTRRAPAEATRQPKSRKPKPERERRLTWKERGELEALPALIESLETERAGLHERVAAPGFYREGGDRVAGTTGRLEAIEAELAALYERWQELEAIAGLAS